MPRVPKKAEDKGKVPLPVPIAQPPPQNVLPMPISAAAFAPQLNLAGPVPNTRPIDLESFARVRDSTLNSIHTILRLVQTLANDYNRQASLLIGEAPGGPLHFDMGGENLTYDAAQMLMPAQEAGPAVEEKKERKKRTHDPNAPKRPLTPYFLYMQHARSIIAIDLGAEAPKGAVQEEGQRRWAHMSPNEKQGWNNAYQYNLRLYNARVHSYKAGNLLAKNMTDEEALKYAEDFNVPMPEIKDAAAAHNEVAANDQDAIAQQLAQVAAAPASGEESVAKTPKKTPASKKRKTATPASAAPPVPEEAKATPASPEKKRRRTSTKAPEDKEEPKKSGRKKTKSS